VKRFESLLFGLIIVTIVAAAVISATMMKLPAPGQILFEQRSAYHHPIRHADGR
jgi:hypothetical protein